jgi:uncharacterized membrane protein YgcG
VTLTPGKYGHVSFEEFAGSIPNSPWGSSGASVTCAWQTSSITGVVVAVTEQPSKTVLAVFVHGVYVTPAETDSVQNFVISVAVCFLVQLSNIVVVVPVTSHPCVMRLLVEVHVVWGAESVVSLPMLMPTTSVKMLHMAVTWVAVTVVSHSLSEEEELCVREVEGPVSVGFGVSSGSSSGPGGSSIHS